MLALVCEISRWCLTLILIGISVWLVYLIQKSNKPQNETTIAAWAFLAFSNLEKLMVLCFRDQFFLAQEQLPDTDMCYIYAQACHGLLEPITFYAGTFLARDSILGVSPSRSRHIGGWIWLTAAFFIVCIPIDTYIFIPPAIEGFCVVSLIAGLVAFSNTVIFALKLWNESKNIPTRERGENKRIFSWIAFLLFVYGILSFVDANLHPGDWAVVIRELNFLLSLYFMINVYIYWIILPWKLSTAQSFFKLLLPKKRQGVSRSNVLPIPMKSVLPPPELNWSLKANPRALKPKEDNYKELGSRSEIEKEDASDVLYTPIASMAVPACYSEGQNELEFDIDAGTRRSPKAVLRSIMSFSESCSQKKSINVNPRSLLPPISTSDGISNRPVTELEMSDDERNKGETNLNLGKDEASENEEEDDFMLEREPTLFPSMPCSQRASIIEQPDPLEAQKLSTLNKPKESSKVKSMSLSTTNIEDVFGVGFSETPDGRKRSKRETATWNINDIPVL